MLKPITVEKSPALSRASCFFSSGRAAICSGMNFSKKSFGVMSAGEWDDRPF